jgi:hypothetical protein
VAIPNCEEQYDLLSLVSLAAKASLFSVVCFQRISRGLRRSFSAKESNQRKLPAAPASFSVNAVTSGVVAEPDDAGFVG